VASAPVIKAVREEEPRCAVKEDHKLGETAMPRATISSISPKGRISLGGVPGSSSELGILRDAASVR
jgi:hypothetical protein